MAEEVAATRLDTSERRPVYLIDDGHGGFLRVSATAHLLYSLGQRGVPFSEIAAQIGERGTRAVTAAEVESAYRRLSERIDALRARPRRERAYLVQVPLFSAARVRRVAARGAVWLRAAIAIPLVVVSIALVVPALLGGLPRPTPSSFVYGYLGLLAILLVHELGHASACSRHGAAPSAIGFTIYLIYPAFYSDVTAAWSLSRGQRVVVDLAGVCFQLWATAACAALWLAWPLEPLRVMVWMSVGSMAVSLNPIFKFDGYWVLADALGVPNLAQQPRRLFGHLWSRLRGRPRAPLPWSGAVLAVLVPYALVSAVIFGAFAVYLGPSLWSEAARWPARLTALFGVTSVAQAGPALLALVQSTFTLVVGAWLVLRVVGGAARAGARRWVAR